MADEIRVVLWTGGDAPSESSELTVHVTDGPASMRFSAIWEPGYCGCEDCHPVVGYGPTEEAARVNYWEVWLERHGV